MASTTAPLARPSRIHSGWRSARTALALARTRTLRVASEARHRYRRPSLVIGSFGCIDTSAWTTFGRGAGLLAIGLSLFVFEMLGSDE